jgi:hypothetical protein
MTNTLLEAAAHQRFRSYVQRVAFSLTLSEPMIRALQVIRDYPPYDMTSGGDEYIATRKATEVRSARGPCLWITEFNALERRGLAYYNTAPKSDPWPKGHVFYKLTREGEIVCDLLVCSGLMMPKPAVGFQDNAA